jgi:hypothetical protein
MPVDHSHVGELPNNDDAGARQIGSEPPDQRTDTGAANLLVIGDDDVDRLLQLARREKRDGGEHTGEKALHVTRAAAVELAISELEFEWIVRPSLALDRNAVAVAGEADAAATRPDAREQASLRTVRRGN